MGLKITYLKLNNTATQSIYQKCLQKIPTHFYTPPKTMQYFVEPKYKQHFFP